MTKREQLIRDYRAAYIADFGEDPPLLSPSAGFGFDMTDDIFPSVISFFSANEIKQMVRFMRERVRKKQ